MAQMQYEVIQDSIGRQEGHNLLGRLNLMQYLMDKIGLLSWEAHLRDVEGDPEDSIRAVDLQEDPSRGEELIERDSSYEFWFTDYHGNEMLAMVPVLLKETRPSIVGPKEFTVSGLLVRGYDGDGDEVDLKAVVNVSDGIAEMLAYFMGIWESEWGLPEDDGEPGPY